MFLLIAHDSEGESVIGTICLYTDLNVAKNAATIDYPEWDIYEIDVDTGKEAEWVSTSFYSHQNVIWSDIP